MNNQYRNIIIVGEKDNFISMHYSSPKENDVSFMTYDELPATIGRVMTGTVNELAIINKYLSFIYKNKIDAKCYFAIGNKLYRSINAGTYKNWVKTGKTAAGNPLDKEELLQWTIFMNLYRTLFDVVDFKPLSYYSMKNPKYNVDLMNYNKELINNAYIYLEERKEALLENSLDDILK
jgi:hypothetical protein